MGRLARLILLVTALSYAAAYGTGCDLAPQSPDSSAAVSDTQSLWTYDIDDDVSSDGDLSQDTSLGTPEADDFVAAVAHCGPLSEKTVPGGWQPILATTGGCTAWMPSYWLILGAIDQYVFASDPAQTAAGFILAGDLEGMGWTLTGVADYILDELAKQFGSAEHTSLYFNEVDNTGIPSAEVLYSFTSGDRLVVGYAHVILFGCSGYSNSCNVSVTGFWIPADDMEKYACTAAQTAASLVCPVY